jgi:small neutral amino acid transporter SnatA (MarC family)
MGLLIIIATCLGLMRHFNKIILAFIVFMDLAYILINYMVLFTYYEYVQTVLGETTVNIIKQIS